MNMNEIMMGNHIKNVVFLSIDALRPDRLSYEGYHTRTSPNIDALASNGVYCSNTFAPANPTQFGFPCVFTSSLPLDFGGYDEGIRTRPVSFPEVLKDNGFKTCAITANVNLNTFFFYDRGFDEFYEMFDIENFWNNMRKIYFSYYKKLRDMGEISSEEYSETLRSFVGKCLHYVLVFCDKRLEGKPHSGICNDYISKWHDYSALREAVLTEIKHLIHQREKYPVNRLEELASVSLYDFLGINASKINISNVMNQADIYLGKALNKINVQFDERKSRKIKGEHLADNVAGWIKENKNSPFFIWTHLMDIHDKNFTTNRLGLSTDYAKIMSDRIRLGRNYEGDLTYDFSLRYVDTVVGRIVSTLKTEGIFENTLIVICGDHGHRAGKPYREGSSPGSFFEEDIKVPLIFFNPGIKKQKISSLCGLMDIAPTILSIMGIEKVKDFKGTSVLFPEVEERDYVVLENNFRGPCDLKHKPIYAAVRAKDAKYIKRESVSFNDKWSRCTEELYDLARDPEEKTNLIGDVAYSDVHNRLNRIVESRIAEIRGLSCNKIEDSCGKDGLVLWLTGVSGVGKTTYANALNESLCKEKFEIVDGDKFREMFGSDLGYEYKDRLQNVKRVASYVRILSRKGKNVIVANIAPYYEARDFIRESLESYIQVYLKAGIEVLEQRDPKGYYAKAKSGQLKNIIGLDDPYHEPRRPDLVIDTGKTILEEGVKLITEYLRQKHLRGR